MSDPTKATRHPAFDLPTDGAAASRSAELAGRPYVIYFYPKDDTPGCTKEAIGFSASYDQFQKPASR